MAATFYDVNGGWSALLTPMPANLLGVGSMALVKPPAERFWPKVRKTETCWLWIGARYASGYGAFHCTDGSRYAHRWAYEALVGSIPDDLTLDHLCRVRHCVNPAHLEPVTMAVNCLRGESLNARNARKTVCVRGHEYTEANTARQPNGHRRCRECNRENMRQPVRQEWRRQWRRRVAQRA